MYSDSVNPIPMPRNQNGIRTLIGKSEEDCRNQLFEKYGNSYDILSRRPILKGGFLGFMQKEYYEVSYVVNPKPMTSDESFEKNKEEILKKVAMSVSSTSQIASLNKQIDDLKKTLSSKLEAIEAATSATDKHPSIQKIETLLRQNEFSLSFINNITSRMRNEFAYEELENFDLVEQKVVDWIGESIKIFPQVRRKLPHVIVLVGTTGVGKTTTIAKMAGKIVKEAMKNEEKLQVRMITIDNTRVAAEEQLRRFGDIMGLPVDKAKDAKDVKQIFDTYKDNLDVLFIDTPGFSPKDFENIAKMRAILDIPGLHPDVYLAVDATRKANDILATMQNYATFNFESVILTKWDETSVYGNVLSVLSEQNKPISYITDGQKVPTNIERASVVKFLTHLYDFKIDRVHIEDTFPEE
ncbi:GTPase [Treponema zioleckii]|uniref:GTPase n=1 Tax=Treponema zioleckii TaxID=331680 RepID=UPI00168B8EE7|nr:GTPase [Treponema zioleckii]